MNNYATAWAYLQGVIETLCPLVPELSATKVQERLQYALTAGASLAQSNIPNRDNSSMEFANGARAGEMPPISPNASGGVYFPHDLQHSGEGTFTAPGATEEEIEALMKQRYPDREE